MGAQEVFAPQQIELPPSEIRKKVASETLKVKQNWRRTVTGILAIGCSLMKIKAMLPHKNFIDHIQENFGLNEMGASEPPRGKPRGGSLGKKRIFFWKRLREWSWFISGEVNY